MQQSSPEQFPPPIFQRQFYLLSQQHCLGIEKWTEIFVRIFIQLVFNKAYLQRYNNIWYSKLSTKSTFLEKDSL